jgi:hypothetical protein
MEQGEAEALFLNSGPAETDYGKNSGCPPLLKGHINFEDPSKSVEIRSSQEKATQYSVSL